MEQSAQYDVGAVPAVAPEPTTPAAVQRFTCDGEVFELSSDESGGMHYAWISGPNSGYGFSASPAPDRVEEHESHIRGFLSMIDPETGYIAED